jgi:hypothetical protein
MHVTIDAPRFASAPLRPPAASSPAPPQDQFSWGKALALPAYTFGAGSAGLSALCGFADRFPYGGATINPNGVILNPEWTRHFGPDTMLRGMQPILASFGAAICLVRGALEMREGLKSGCARTQLAAVLDIGLAASSALQIASPGIGGAASLALVVARGLVDAHP